MKSACLYKTLAEEEYIRFGEEKCGKRNPKNHAESRANFCSREKEENAHTERERERVKYTFENASEKNLSRE